MSRHMETQRLAPPLRIPQDAAPRQGSFRQSSPQDGPTLRVDWPQCKAHGLCHELLPELIELDEWGYPVVAGTPVPEDLLKHARRAVRSCPTLALLLLDPH